MSKELKEQLDELSNSIGQVFDPILYKALTFNVALVDVVEELELRIKKLEEENEI